MRTFTAFPIIVSVFAAGCVQLPPVPIPDPPVGQVVVLDIDGTLTPHNLSVFEARPDADKVVAAYVRKGYKIVYVTTRVPAFQSGLEKWLKKYNFPSGPVHIAQNDQERKMPATFKAEILRTYTKANWHLSYAYGDSSTDFLAYMSAGIPQGRIFALKRQGSEDCEGGGFALCLDEWTAHIGYVEKEVPSLK
ncbi:MAG: HAD family acid phosphatase [Thiobacillus sp.]|nr:HAD family acid phosphatase [Thiobacillus sp.]